MRDSACINSQTVRNSRSQSGYVRVREVPRKVHMAILDKVGQEKQRVSERLARLDMERARLSQELRELEIADPYYDSDAEFETALAQIEAACAGLAQLLDRRLRATQAEPTRARKGTPRP